MDDAKHELAERVVKHLEQSGFELDDQARTPAAAPAGAAPLYATLGGSLGL